MNDSDRIWARPPLGGEWYNNSQQAAEYADAQYGKGGGFVCGWEMPLSQKGNSFGYFYGAYASYEEFMSASLQLGPDSRYGFEMIRETQQCNMYFDIEWYGEQDLDKILRILTAIRVYLRLKFAADFALQITCGSRQTHKGFKNSYHIVVTGLSFTNNYGGMMKKCALGVEASLELHDRLSIDMAVYTRNRLMRTVLSCKRGSHTPLRNITGDSFSKTSTLFSDRVYADGDAGALGNCSITCHVHRDDAPDIVLVQGDDVSISIKKISSIERKKSSVVCMDATSLASCKSIFPENVTRDLQEMCESNLSVGCEVTGRYIFRDHLSYAQCRNFGPRHCIANDCRHVHDNENAFLSFEGGHVRYKCYSANCKGTSRVLGEFPASLKTFSAVHVANTKASARGRKRIRVELDAEDIEIDACGEDIEMEACGEDISMDTDETMEVPEDAEPLHRVLSEAILHFTFPELHEKHKSRAKFITKTHLDKEMYDDNVRIHLVESSCNTGKTTSVFAYARVEKLRILAVSTRISQLDAHEAVIANSKEKSERYDGKTLAESEIGTSHLLSTIDSVSRIVSFLKRTPENAKHFILFLDEFHSIVQYLYDSDTLLQKRRRVLKDLQWLIRHTNKVIAADNTLSDHDFYFLESSLSETGAQADLTFHINTFQTFEGTPAVYCSDREKMYQMMKAQNDKKEGFVVACNTKADTKYFYRRLYDDTTCEARKAGMCYYDGDTSKATNIPDDIIKRWRGFPIFYSPKITTGVDYHPEDPTNVYFFVRGETTVCPATAVQMVTRTRNIKTLYICADRMRNTPRFASEGAMNAHLDMLQKSFNGTTFRQQLMTEFREVSVLSGLVDTIWSSEVLEDTYSENKFSQGYRDWLWHHYVMQASWVINFNTYLEKRGFVVTSEEAGVLIPLEDREFCKGVVDRCKQHSREELELWKADKTTPKKDIFDTRLVEVRQLGVNLKSEDACALLHTAKTHLNTLINSFEKSVHFWARVRVNNIFLYNTVYTSNQNILLGIYTLDKLHKIQAHDHKVEYDLPNAHTACTSVLLLRELIMVFNVGMPESLHLKTYDITLAQKSYDEDEEIEITDALWGLYTHKCRSTKKQPTTRRGLLTAIFSLSQKIFGKYFTMKNETCRMVHCEKKKGSKQVKCYNYVGDDMFLRVHVDLADWSKRDLLDIEPAIVAKYNLKALRAVVMMKARLLFFQAACHGGT